MSDSQVEEIKNRLNILDVVGSYVKLTKTGINYRGVCPFHKEKSPSFFVNPSRQLWHCFGCGAGSSLFDFIMKIEGVEFGDALRILAAKAGVQLKRENVQLRTERQRLYEICELATKFFQKQLESGVGKEAQDYLQKRGISKDSIGQWRIGYSPDKWSALTEFLISRGYQRAEIIKAGVAIQKENNPQDSYDRFRGRIIFPVFDINGQPIGFGGRVFKQQETAKYINTPQTLLYDKSGTLYGLHNAKVGVRKQSQCVVTEGYTDVIMCHQAGFDNVVAASGTALTERHLGILKRYTENLVLAFDMDVAGDSATKRGINLAEEQGFNIRIIEHYGDDNKKSDPADIILKDPKIWEESLTKAKSIMDYYYDSAFAQFDKASPEGKKNIGAVVLPAIKRLPNKIEQSHWIQKLAQGLQVTEDIILQELAKIKTEKRWAGSSEPLPQEHDEKKAVSEAGRKTLLEEKIVALVLKSPDLITLITNEHQQLFSDKIKDFLIKIKKVAAEMKPNEGEVVKSFKDIFHESADAELKNFMAALALKADAEYLEDGADELKLCLLQIKQIELKKRLTKISEDIKQAEAEKNQQKIEDLVKEFNALAREL